MCCNGEKRKGGWAWGGGAPFLGMPAFPYDSYPVAAELCFTCEILVTGLGLFE